MAKLHPDLQNKSLPSFAQQELDSFGIREFWYKDITLIPNRLPDFERDEVNLTASFTKKIILKTPFVSSPMDTVTGSEMAILMALMGGIGVIHYNYSSIEDQMKEVEKVKRFQAGFVFNPVVLSPQNTIKDIYEVNNKYGFFSAPITEDGTLNSKLVGIVTRRDVRYRKDMGTELKEVMTPREKLIVAFKKETVDRNDLQAANKVLKKNNLDTLPIVDEADEIVALVTDSDIRKNEQFPLATKNNNKQLRVFIAVESRLQLAKERIKKAYAFGVDGIVIDASIVFREQIEIAKHCKQNFPELEVVLGNIDSAQMVERIMEEGADYCDALRVGVGPGAACITQQELGTGRAQASAVWDCAHAVKRLEPKYGPIPIIADGGIKVIDEIGQDVQKPGDISKALALGAQTVMMGSLLAGLEESPGEKEFDYEENRMVKKYRGMGSLEAMEGRSATRYAVDKTKTRIAEGVVMKVPYRGPGYDFLLRLIIGVKQSLQKQGFKNIKELQKYADIRPI
ncbi:IMP dehydrogenase [Patescibacteria group bacterium]|nr:IMP dehydrogenase [Patescibacteria group bacterium]